MACKQVTVMCCNCCRSLHRDKEEAEAVRQARLLEEEKAQFSVRINCWLWLTVKSTVDCIHVIHEVTIYFFPLYL